MDAIAPQDEMQTDPHPSVLGGVLTPHSDNMDAVIAASEWLAHPSRIDLDAAHRCGDRLEFVLGYDQVPGFGPAVSLRTKDILSLLSSEWLGDDILNAGLDWLMQQHTRTTSRIRLGNCLLVLGLAGMKRRGSYNPRKCSPLDQDIRSGQVDVLYIPLHVSGNHWTLLCVNISSGSYTYADSRNAAATPPSDTIGVLFWWLTSLLPHLKRPLISAGKPDWVVPVQEDIHSCGVVVLSSLGAILLGEPPWAQHCADMHRMEWFIRLTAGLADGDEEGDTEDLGDDGTLPDVIMDDTSAATGVPPPPSFSGGPRCAMVTLTLDAVDWDSYLGTGDSPLSDESPNGSCDAPLAQGPVSLTPSPASLTLPSPRPSPSAVPTGPSTRAGKRALPSSDVPSASDDDSRSRKPRLTSHVSSRPSSWSYQKDLVEQSKLPDFEADEEKLAKFRKKILADDPHVFFDPIDCRRLRCSACATWVVVPLLYDVSGWRVHRKSGKCGRNRSTGLVSTSLLTWCKPVPKESQSISTLKPPPPRDVPCPGVQRAQDERVSRYLARTSTNGGGAPSRAALARELFQTDARPAEECSWVSLSFDERRMVICSEEARFRWRNLRSVGAVYSTSCEGTVRVLDIQVPAKPCARCLSLLHVAVFRTQLNREMPDESNMKYTPWLYQNKEMGAIYLKYLGVRQLLEEGGHTPWRKFGMGVAAGTFKNSRVMLGAIEAMQIRSERMAQGKQMQNMTYSREFTDFANVLASISTRAYQTFRHHFGGPHVRTLQKLRARLPRFQPGISSANVALASAVLTQLDYTGPVVLAWDDTALEPAISVWEDAATGICSILGSTHGVMQVASADEFDAIFDKAKMSKADKIRLFVLIVPLTKVPPLLLAAVARGGKENAQDLLDIHNELLGHLHAHEIYPVSYAADGTEVERALQRKIIAATHRFSPYIIPNDVPGCTIELRIHTINKHPVITVQDPKHALKTARNQLFTGARILVLGCLAFFYAQLLLLSQHILSPLFRRDVEKVDKQDDRAAARLFSAESLDVVLRYHSEFRALAVYLYALGELVDAWENRQISHVERARMVMSTRFFLMAWRTHIVLHPAYSTNVQFISRKSFDIFIMLCDSLLSLIVVYRQYFPYHPLMPWLHSTTPCEHIFGIIRTLKKDFNFADLLYLESKLRTLLLGAFDRLTPLDRANERAAGYYHSYFDSTGVDADNLRQWPSEIELQEASRAAFLDAEQLLESVQLNARKLLQQYKPPTTSEQSTSACQRGATSTCTPTGPQSLADLLTLYARIDLDPVREQEVTVCEIALVAESMDGTIAINALPDACDATELPVVKTAINDQLLSPSKPKARAAKGAPESYAKSQCMSEPLYNSITKELNVAVLKARRLRHQTSLAEKAVRQYQQPNKIAPSPSNVDGGDESSLTLRQQLLQRLAGSIPENETFNATSGVDRHVRHTGTFHTSTDSPARVAQKKTLRSVAANNHCRLRAEALLVLQDLHEQMSTANISPLSPLVPGCFIVVLHYAASARGAPRLLLGRVLTMYTKSDARGSRHEHMERAKNVGYLSYVAVEVFVFSHNSTYSSLACPSLGSSTILRFPPTQVLFSFATCSKSIMLSKITTPDGSSLTLATLCDFSASILEQLVERTDEVATCIKKLSQLSNKQKRTTLAVVEEEQGGSSSDDDGDM